MKRLLVSVALIFLSLNISAAISQDGITNLKQLDSNGIIELISGNQLTGFISDGPFQGPVVQTFFKNGKYETIFEDKIYKGVWKVENKKYCSKNNTKNNFNCVYWYTGNKDGGTYAYIIAQGQIFHQYHEVKSVVQINQEKKKAEEAKRIADAKKAEEKKKAAEEKRIADAKKTEEKKKAAEAKRIADAKKAEEKRKAEEEKKRIDEIQLTKKLKLIPPETRLQKAQNFITDIESFTSTNPSEFDIMEIAMFKINTKLLAEGISNDEQLIIVDTFKKRTRTSNSFLSYEKKRKTERNKILLKTIDAEITSLDLKIKKMQSFSKQNLASNSISLLNEKIKSSLSIYKNPSSLSELKNVNNEIDILFTLLNEEAKRTAKSNSDKKQLLEALNRELLQLDYNISNLKLYMAENLATLSHDFVNILVEKVNILNTVKNENNKQKNLNSLININQEILNFVTSNKISTSQDLIKQKKMKEEKIRAEEKQKAKDANKRNLLIAKQSLQIEKGDYSSLLDGSFRKNPKNLPICQPSLAEIDMDTQVWDNCWGTQTWSGDRQSQMCAGNCPITRIREGEYQDFKWDGLGINYYPESIWIETIKDGKQVGYFLGIEGWGFTQRSECKLLNSIYVDDAWVDSEKTDCNIRALSPIFPTYDCRTSYPFICELNVSENFLKTPIEKEFVSIESARVHEQPFNDSKLVKTIPKGTVVFVISKTETNDWYSIKEIRDNGMGEDIGEKIGYSLVDSFQSMDEITLSNISTYSDPPGNVLIDAYTYYVIIKKMHSMREGYAVVYINDNEMKKVKKQMGEIEKILVNEYSLDKDLFWDIAMRKYDQDYSIIDLMESSGIYTDEGSRLAKITLLSFGNIAKEVIVSSTTKDF